MPRCASAASDALSRIPWKKWRAYFAKSVVLLGAFFLIGYFAPRMPSLAVAVLWALMSAVSTVGFVYLSAVKKTLRQNKYQPGGWFARLNNGRIGSIVVGFVLSALFAAGLFFEIPRWGTAEWALVACSIPLYLGISLLASRFLSREYQPLFRTGGVARISCIATGIVLLLAFALISWLAPEPGYASILEAQQAASQAFVDSPSLLIYDLGNVAALSDAITMYGVSLAARTNGLVYVAARVVVCASIFFGIANLLSLCYLNATELRRAFSPLVTDEGALGRTPLTRRFVAVAVALPVCLAIAFMAADHHVNQAEASGEYSAMKQAVRDYLGLTVCTVSGSAYAPQTVAQAAHEARQDADALSQEARDTLTPLIDASLDARADNVDSYLDWYFDLSADASTLERSMGGMGAEEYAERQLEERLGKGVDDTELVGKLVEYSGRATQLYAKAVQSLSGHELTHLPEWLVKTEEPYDSAFLDECLGPARALLDASELMDVGDAADADDAISRDIAERAKDKGFYADLTARLSEALEKAGESEGDGVFDRLGHLVGSAVSGAVESVSRLFGVDDESRNRDAYKQEILDAIEEERADLLALIGE